MNDARMERKEFRNFEVKMWELMPDEFVRSSQLGRSSIEKGKYEAPSSAAFFHSGMHFLPAI